MGIKVTKSRDDAGVYGAPQSGILSSTVSGSEFNIGGAIRDLLINYNAQIRFDRNRTFENPTFAIDTNFDIKNTEPVTYFINGVAKTLADNTSFNTGTAATITAAKWGIALLIHDGTTATVQWSSASVQGYATEALAIADLGKKTLTCVPANYAGLGYVTVLAGASLWTAGTDALEGGAGGTPATTTNYYNDPSMNGTFGGWQIGNLSGTAISQ